MKRSENTLKHKLFLAIINKIIIVNVLQVSVEEASTASMAVGQGMADILADIQVLEAMTDILAGIKDSL